MLNEKNFSYRDFIFNGEDSFFMAFIGILLGFHGAIFDNILLVLLITTSMISFCAFLSMCRIYIIKKIYEFSIILSAVTFMALSITALFLSHIIYRWTNASTPIIFTGVFYILWFLCSIVMIAIDLKIND